MKNGIIAACAAALLIGGTVYGQDTVEKNKVKVDVDDAHSAVMTGCLMQDPSGVVTLTGATAVVGKDVTVETRTKTDVDDDDKKVETKSTAKLEDADKKVGTSGTIATYVVTPRTGVELASHVGHQVEITAVVVDAKKGGDDDAKVKIEDLSKVEVENAPDGKAKTTTKLELPRGSQPVLTAVAIKTLSPTCR